MKKQMINQLALTSYIGSILGISDRSAANIAFSKSSGTILQRNFHPSINDFAIPCSHIFL
jgi:hypothetical protein